MSSAARRRVALLLLAALTALGAATTLGSGAAGADDRGVRALAGGLRFLTGPELPAADQGQPYATTLRAVGSAHDPDYVVTGGALPEGLALSGDGVISGVPTVAGISTFSVTAAVSGAEVEPTTQQFVLQVSRAETCMGQVATIVGTSGADVLVGTPGDDVIAAVYGDDRVDGAGGDDIICGGFGQDLLVGGAGDDILIGGAGHDQVVAGAGDDDLRGQAGADVLLGEAGSDGLNGGVDADTCSGGPGLKDTVRACEDVTAVP